MSLLRPATKALLACFTVLFVFACSGGGCSGCAIQPIPSGFPDSQPRLANAGQIRLTSGGIDFLERNVTGLLDRFVASAEGGALTFNIPSTAVGSGALSATICPASNCAARGEIQSIDLVPTGPNQLRAIIQLLVDSRNTSGARAPLPVRALGSTVNVDLDTRRGSRVFITMETTISFSEETRAPRRGLTRIDIGTISEVPGQGIEDADLSFSGGFLGWLADLFRGTIVNQLRNQLGSFLDGAFDDQLCARPGPSGCPTGSVVSGSGMSALCRFTGSTDCVPMLLGADGQGDLGTFLSSISSGTHAPVQYLLASGGTGVAVNNGMSLYMTGGFLSYDRAFRTTPGHNTCVPLTTPPPLPTVARVPAFQGNNIPATAIPVHLGIGVSEDYLNYAGWGMFDSGMFCIGAGTRLSQQLSTGMLALLIPTLRSLVYPIDAAPLALSVRPQQPPRFAIGATSAEPILTLTLPQLQVDFYVWSQERYVRIMTYQADVVVALNLAVEGSNIVPTIRSLETQNPVVTNSELLAEAPATLATTVGTVLSLAMSAISIPSFAIPPVMGFNITIPAGGLRGVSDGGERFLGIFANLALAPSSVSDPVETTLEVSDLSLVPESMVLEGFDRAGRNTLWLHFGSTSLSSEGRHEYSYRIDGGTWSEWTTERRVQVDHPALLFQANHTIEARARVEGSPTSVDLTPAIRNVIVDIQAPEVEVEEREDGAGVHVNAADIVSHVSALQMRWRVAGGEYGAWGPITDLDVDAAELELEVRDEVGNLTHVTPALIRGIPNPSAAAGCGCTVQGRSMPSTPAWLLLTVLGVMTLRRRFAVTSAVSVALVLGSGCDCGGPAGTPDAAADGPMAMMCGAGACTPALPPATTSGSICCMARGMCVNYDVNALCPSGQTCAVANVSVDATCAVSCTMCMPLPPLEPGILATDLDLAVDGPASYLSGYSPGVPTSSRYGDLVFGSRTGDTGAFTWEIVDGAPSMPVTNAVTGWRRGVSAPGDDVGRRTSMVRGSDGTFYISYYDVTNSALKVAIGRPGAFTTHVVDAMGDAGSFSSIALTASGAPAIAYMRLDTGTDGTVSSSVRVATASSAMPRATTDWTSAMVSSATVPCRARFCSGTDVCVASSGRCAAPGSGCASCAAGTACVAGSCQAVFARNYVEDLFPGHGLFVQLARAGSNLALVFYDRNRGDLYGAASSGSTWGAPFLIDGYSRRGGTGDSGIAASLAIDGTGAWHVAYVDGTDEALHYARVSGSTVTENIIVDDGSTVDGTMRHADGRHVIGDDASIVVTDAGEIRIAYQDGTAHSVVLARRASGGRTFSIAVLDEMNATGFWVEQERAGTGSRVATWWRQQTGSMLTHGVRLHAVP